MNNKKIIKFVCLSDLQTDLKIHVSSVKWQFYQYVQQESQEMFCHKTATRGQIQNRWITVSLQELHRLQVTFISILNLAGKHLCKLSSQTGQNPSFPPIDIIHKLTCNNVLLEHSSYQFILITIMRRRETYFPTRECLGVKGGGGVVDSLVSSVVFRSTNAIQVFHHKASSSTNIMQHF